MWFLALLGPVAKIIGGWLEHKQSMQKAKQEGELQWAATMAAASAGSWKDEYLTLVFTLPIVMAMFGIDQPLSTLLAILETAPGWYTTVILTIVGASFGVNLHSMYKKNLDRSDFVREVMRKNGNGGTSDPYAAVRPDPLPKSDG